MNIFGTGLVWNTAATIASIAGVVVLAICLVLFFLFAKKPELITDGKKLLNEFQKYPLAVVGAFFKGTQKEVGATEYIATLMALEHTGFLTIEFDEDNEASSLSIGDEKEWDIEDPIDKAAINLLRMFAEDDGKVYLETAKQCGDSHKADVDVTYRAWRALVKDTASKSVSAESKVVLVQKVIQYIGYGVLLVAVVCAYFVSLMVCTILAIAGALVILIAQIMQKRITVETQNARKLYLWLDKLPTYTYEIQDDKLFAQMLVEYACLFTLAEKVTAALKGCVAEKTVDQIATSVEFWKNMRTQLYSDAAQLFAKKEKNKNAV